MAFVLKCDVHNEERPRRGRRAEVAILSTPDRVGVEGSGADRLPLIPPLIPPLSNAIKGYSRPACRKTISIRRRSSLSSEAVSKSASRSAQASQRDGTGLGNVLRSPFRRSWRTGPGAGSSRAGVLRRLPTPPRPAEAFRPSRPGTTSRRTSNALPATRFSGSILGWTGAR